MASHEWSCLVTTQRVRPLHLHNALALLHGAFQRARAAARGDLTQCFKMDNCGGGGCAGMQQAPVSHSLYLRRAHHTHKMASPGMGLGSIAALYVLYGATADCERAAC